MLHATAIVVPVAAGMILNYVGYQVPFFIGCGFALVAAIVTLRPDPVRQVSGCTGCPSGPRAFCVHVHQ